MSKIYPVESSDSTLVGVKIDGNISWFENTKAGINVAKQFGLLFHWLTNPKLSKARLDKLNNDLGKNGNEAVT